MATMVSNSKNASKSLVMKSAWSIFKNGEVKSFGDAMRMAWKAIKLRIAMTKGVVKFQYRKASGEVRTAFGTIKSDLVNYTYRNSNRKPCYRVMAYWDVQVQMFRSFSIAHLI